MRIGALLFTVLIPAVIGVGVSAQAREVRRPVPPTAQHYLAAATTCNGAVARFVSANNQALLYVSAVNDPNNTDPSQAEITQSAFTTNPTFSSDALWYFPMHSITFTYLGTNNGDSSNVNDESAFGPYLFFLLQTPMTVNGETMVGSVIPISQATVVGRVRPGIPTQYSITASALGLPDGTVIAADFDTGAGTGYGYFSSVAVNGTRLSQGNTAACLEF